MLRQLRLEDATAYFALRSSAEVMLYVQRPLAVSVEEAKEQITQQLQAQAEGKIVVWAIADLNDVLIGIAGFWRMQLEHQRTEVGYLLDEPYHGQGLGSEALKVILAYGFQNMNLHKIEADVDPDNLASLRMLQRFGFKQEALFRENRLFNNQFYDSCWLGLLRREWDQR
jgi:ribosomal-protein-alanine N-acetyltransferase